jgi:hypothetical protein
MNATTDTPLAHSPDASSAEPAKSDFVYEVDEVEYHSDRPKLTGAQIMAAAAIPSTEGLVQLLPDGITATVNPTDEVHLVPDAQFKRRPKFKRG